MTDIDETLINRGQRYGAFSTHSIISQNLKRAMAASPNWPKLEDDQKEALEMVAHKVARILNGDPNYLDSWHDIIGYTKLVEARLALDLVEAGPPSAVHSARAVQEDKS